MEDEDVSTPTAEEFATLLANREHAYALLRSKCGSGARIIAASL
jgi:hypothetical protein